MSTSLRYTFVLFALLTFLAGVPLLVAPGRFLGLIGWAPVDTILSRIMGAALWTLAWAAVRGARASEPKQVGALIQIEAVFCVLATAGILRHLLGGASYGPAVWIVAVVLALFALAWIVFGIKAARAN